MSVLASFFLSEIEREFELDRQLETFRNSGKKYCKNEHIAHKQSKQNGMTQSCGPISFAAL